MSELSYHSGTKTLLAKPMTRGEYNDYRGWSLPEDESPDDPGYLVEYTDSLSEADPRHKGHISWSPEHVFDMTYRPANALAFSDVIAGLKRGYRYARRGWNGKGMFVFLVPGSRFTVNREPLLSILGEGTEVDYLPHIDMKMADGRIMTWTPAQADILSEDWMLV